jgi:FKBP-type peptidyl-prolyl cis-trans isomerase
MIGCGGGESSRPPPETTASTATTAPAQTEAKAEAKAEEDEYPKIDTVHGVAPNPWKEPAQWRLKPHPHFRLDHVVVKQIGRGHGPAARAHDSVYVDFIEADYRKALKFNRSWGSGHYGTTGLILTPRGATRGLVAGMRGMRAGTRRQILAPPQLSGTELAHADYDIVIYWDVVLRKILANGCSADGRRCRSVAP